MNWIVGKMKWIMLLAGVLTCTMLYAAVAPQAALRATFGETLEGPLAEIVVRNWGALITLVGAMLMAGISKLVFIGLVLAQGAKYLATAGVALAIDLALVTLFALYLIGASRKPGGA